MKKMLKRADGSTSQRGLWDNIRAKAASNKKAGKKGKAPSKAMLEQERKIEKKKMGGNWMEDSKELKFGGPTKYQTGNAKEEVTPTPTYTKFTLSPMEPEEEVKKDNFIRRTIDKISDRFASTAGGGNKGGGSTAFDKGCIGKDCGKMMSAKGGKETNQQNQDGSTGLSKKPLYRDRLANQTEEEKEAGLENRAKYAAEGEAAKAKKKAERDARAAASAPTPTGVYGNPRDLTPMRMKKTGGKKTYFKK